MKQSFNPKRINVKARIKTSFPPITAWRYDKDGHAAECVERFCELACKTRQHLKLTETPCMDDPQVTPQYFNVVGELAPVCAQLVLKCKYLTRVGRTDLTVDRKYAVKIRHTNEHRLWSNIGTIVKFPKPLDTLQTI